MTETICPGCGLRMPKTDKPFYHKYYNASPECWGLYTEVLSFEYSNPVLFGQIHQLTVDTYAVQHPGGLHPDKSIDLHLVSLYLILNHNAQPMAVPPKLQHLADVVQDWPHFPPPHRMPSFTVFDVGLSDSPEQHTKSVREWSALVWQAWLDHHGAIASLAAKYLDIPAVR